MCTLCGYFWMWIHVYSYGLSLSTMGRMFPRISQWSLSGTKNIAIRHVLCMASFRLFFSLRAGLQTPWQQIIWNVLIRLYVERYPSGWSTWTEKSSTCVCFCLYINADVYCVCWYVRVCVCMVESRHSDTFVNASFLPFNFYTCLFFLSIHPLPLFSRNNIFYSVQFHLLPHSLIWSGSEVFFPLSMCECWLLSFNSIHIKEFP